MKIIILLALITLLSGCKDYSHHVTQGEWYTVRSPITGICYEMFMADRRAAMSEIDCGLLR